jgi:5-methylcytosine-specific restriction enzyme A
MAWSKESRKSRGYGPEWDKLRKTILERDFGICRPCKAKGIIHAGTHVDHIISKAKAKAMGWTKAQIDHPSNLQCINADCHEAKTAEEQGKKIRPKVMIGLDGFPVDEG